VQISVNFRSVNDFRYVTSMTRRVFSWPWNVMKYIGSCSKRSAYSSNRSRFFTRLNLPSTVHNYTYLCSFQHQLADNLTKFKADQLTNVINSVIILHLCFLLLLKKFILHCLAQGGKETKTRTSVGRIKIPGLIQQIDKVSLNKTKYKIQKSELAIVLW